MSTQAQIISTLSVIVVSVIIYWVAGRVGRRAVKRMEAKGFEVGQRATTLWTVLRRLLMLVLAIVGLLFGFQIWNVPTAPFIAVGTVLAAAIGFGAQDLVKDFIGGFFILLEDQFQIGDVVTIAGTSGLVEDIQLRVTKLRDLEGNAHFVPNGQITVSSNYTSRFAQPVIDVGVAYETDIDHAIEVLGDELRALSEAEGYSEYISGVEVLGVKSLDDSAVTLRARFTTDPDQRWAVQREALRRVKNRFDAEGISIPFPQVTVNQKKPG